MANEEQKFNLSDPGVTKAVAKHILEDVDEFCKTKYDGGHRTHLGASLIGDECKRKLWYVFRWVKKENFSGQMLRLFNRGHKEEFRFLEWLEGMGCKVWTDDLENNTLYWVDEVDEYYLNEHENETMEALGRNVSKDKKHVARARLQGVEFPQYIISGVDGHYGGSLDGIVLLPKRYGIDEPVLLECKTNKTGGFSDLANKGMERAKPQHFAQNSCYGDKYKFNYCLYMNINKNNDEIYVELVKLNHTLGKQMELKAEQIITSQTPPPKLSMSDTFWKCKMCNFNAICHKGDFAELNCRSCFFAVPAKNAQWLCEHPNNNGIIPKDFIPKGCNSYKSITSNV